MLQATPRRPLGTRTPTLAGRPHRLLATTRRAGQAVAAARPGSRHPGRAARPARAPRHHPGAGQRHRRPPALDHPLPQRPLPAPPRRGRGARPRATRPRRARTAAARPRRATPPRATRRSRQVSCELSDAIARWWVLDDDHRARRREADALGLDRSRRRGARRRALRHPAADPRRVRAPSGLRHPLRLRARRAPPPAPGRGRPSAVQHRPHPAAPGPRAAPVGPLGRGVHRRHARRDPPAPGTRRQRRRASRAEKRSAIASARSCRSTD